LDGLSSGACVSFVFIAECANIQSGRS